VAISHDLKIGSEVGLIVALPFAVCLFAYLSCVSPNLEPSYELTRMYPKYGGGTSLSVAVGIAVPAFHQG
jgi:hypothetical protein